jgi:hypothetical protein
LPGIPMQSISDLESGAHSDYKADELPKLAERI